MDSGSESTKLRMVVRVHPESLHASLGRDLGSHESPKHVSGVRFLDGLQAWQAAHLVVGSVSYAERAGFDSLACYRPMTWRADHLGVMAVPHTAGAGFDSLARYHVPFAQWQVLSPDKRPTKVRLLHGTRSDLDPHGVRGVVVSTRVRDSRGEGSIPFAHPTVVSGSVILW